MYNSRLVGLPDDTGKGEEVGAAAAFSELSVRVLFGENSKSNWMLASLLGNTAH